MPGGAGTPGGYGGGPDFGGGGGNGGGPHGGGGGEGGAAQRAAAQRAQAQLDADRLNAQIAAAAIARENEARETARENAIQLAALTPKTIEPVRSPFSDTPLQVLEQQILDTTKPTTPDILPEFKKRGITTITGGSPHTEGPIDRIVYQPTDLPKRTYDPRTDPNALLKRPGGIGSFFKNAAMAVVPGLLPAKLAQGYRLAKLGYDLKNRKGVYGTALRLGENLIGKNVGDFIKTGGSQFDRLNPNEMKNVRTFKPTRDRDEERVKTVAERVTTGAGLESGEKLLGVQNTQKAELFKRRSMVEDILRKGSYQGRNLTFEQKNNLRNYIEQINKFLVPVQQGI